MSTTLSPLVSEFETAEQEVSYTKWLRTKVAANLADPRPAIPHDEVERRMAERFERLRQKKTQSMMLPNFWLETALGDLDTITDYIGEHSIDAAERMWHRL